MFLIFLSKRPLSASRRGFVLVSVLMLGVVFISCATAFAWFVRQQIKGTLREKSALEYRSMAQVLTQSICSGLKSNTVTKHDSLLQEWFKPFFFPTEDLGLWVVQVTPLDDKIPLRGIFLPDGNTLRNELRNAWEKLWEQLGKRNLGPLVLDFMDKDKRPQMGGGAERDTHIDRYPLDMSEFLILDEMTPEILNGGEGTLGMADYCTLWSSGKINLNVAPVHVMAILPGLNETLAENIDNYRRSRQLRDMADLRKVQGFPAKASSTLMNLAAFNSRYFKVHIEILNNSGESGKRFDAVIDKTAGQIVRWEEI